MSTILNGFFLMCLAMLVLACARKADEVLAESDKIEAIQGAEFQSSNTALSQDSIAQLRASLDVQPEDVKSRYAARNPAETLAFFAIQPGMTVVEVLPGGGWYPGILAEYLGETGHLIGANYSFDMLTLVSSMSEERLKAHENWATTWPEQMKEKFPKSLRNFSAFSFVELPSHLNDSADAVLFVRALHNLARFNKDGEFLKEALTDSHRTLKPNGTLGAVQHASPDNLPDEWSGVQNGYLKERAVIAEIEAAGFEFMGSSNINFNPKDKPTVADTVWRLAPTLSGSKNNSSPQATMREIGESNRMTLLFRKRSNDGELALFR